MDSRIYLVEIKAVIAVAYLFVKLIKLEERPFIYRQKLIKRYLVIVRVKVADVAQNKSCCMLRKAA